MEYETLIEKFDSITVETTIVHDDFVPFKSSSTNSYIPKKSNSDLSQLCPTNLCPPSLCPPFNSITVETTIVHDNFVPLKSLSTSSYILENSNPI